MLVNSAWVPSRPEMLYDTGWYTSHHGWAPSLVEARVTDSCGGATCTAPYPAGPSWVVQAVAMESKFHSHRFAVTSLLLRLTAALAVAARLMPTRPAAASARLVTEPRTSVRVLFRAVLFCMVG